MRKDFFMLNRRSPGDDSSCTGAFDSSCGLRLALECARQVIDGAFGIVFQLPVRHFFHSSFQVSQTLLDVRRHPDRLAFSHLKISLKQFLKPLLVSEIVEIFVYLCKFGIDEFIVLCLLVGK